LFNDWKAVGMTELSRRRFLAAASAGVVAASVLPARQARAASANERFRVGVIGCGSQGHQHFKSLAQVPNAELVSVADIDQTRLDQAIAETGARGVTDFRKILDDPSIDGVTVVVPDHWHVAAALMALDAGKHVYVEKPGSKNFHEGELLLKAASDSKQVVQHGTQSRSCKAFQQAIDMLHNGLVGDVIEARCWNWQTRKSIGHERPSTPPPSVDYDTWVGPAEWMPFQKNRFHYDWHWWYDFGTGDMGNDGAHEIDYALWGLGVQGNPTRVVGSGGILVFDDDRQWPDTQHVTLEYATENGPRLMTYEQRLWSNSYPYNVDSGAEFFGTKGKMFISKRGKIEVTDDKKQRVKVELDGSLQAQVSDHMQNWVDSAKDGKQPNAPMEIATATTTAIHLGNIATRLRRSLEFDAEARQIKDDPEANALLTRKYRDGGHWSTRLLS
jgi:predicted dehydrogenase